MHSPNCWLWIACLNSLLGLTVLRAEDNEVQLLPDKQTVRVGERVNFLLKGTPAEGWETVEFEPADVFTKVWKRPGTYEVQGTVTFAASTDRYRTVDVQSKPARIEVIGEASGSGGASPPVPAQILAEKPAGTILKIIGRTVGSHLHDYKLEKEAVLSAGIRHIILLTAVPRPGVKFPDGQPVWKCTPVSAGRFVGGLNRGRQVEFMKDVMVSSAVNDIVITTTHGNSKATLTLTYFVIIH